MTHVRILVLGLAAMLGGCASHPALVALAEPAPLPAPAPPPPPPAGAAAHLTIPTALPDGSYPTPNRDLPSPVAVWHLRAALNVAALVCRRPEEAVLTSGYNRLLAERKGTFAAALKAALAAAGGQAAHDAAMTRLYNYWSQPPAQPGFCARAAEALAAAQAVPAKDKLGPTALVQLAELDRPFTEFYAAYDAWRHQREAATAPAEPIRTAAAGQPPHLGYDTQAIAAP